MAERNPRFSREFKDEAVRVVLDGDPRPVHIQDRVEDVPQVGTGCLSGRASVGAGLGAKRCAQEGRQPEPSACVLDAQSVKTSTNVPAADQGIDAAKKIVGRKRGIVVDTLGPLPAVLVTAASVQDSVAGTTLIDQIATATHHPRT